MIDRLEILVEELLEDLPFTQARAADSIKDKKGGGTESLSGDLRFLGVADYVLHHDISSFKAKLSESAALQISLYERFDRGEPISPSFVSILPGYKALFTALAAGNGELAHQLATLMGGRDEIEKEYDHPFDYTLGYTLKSFVLDDAQAMREWSKRFSAICQEPDNANFRGYAQVFEAILDKDVVKANEGFQSILEGHKKEARTGVFELTPDEMLCVWGIGLGNLCRARNLNVCIDDPLIPGDLLV